MRLLIALLLSTLYIASAAAQMQYPAAMPPEAAWGGYALPTQVPYQPTLDCGPVVPAPGMVGPEWQGYPAVDQNGQAIVLGGTEPFGPPTPLPSNIPADSGYSITSETDLKRSLIPLGSRDGFFQRAKFTATYLPQLSSDSLGWTDLRTEVVTALPFFTRENPIIITPSYELHFLNAPTGIALPPRLHDAVVDFHAFRVFDNKWIADFAVSPGLYSDDYSFDSSEGAPHQRPSGRRIRANGRPEVGARALPISMAAGGPRSCPWLASSTRRTTMSSIRFCSPPPGLRGGSAALQSRAKMSNGST